MAHSLLNLLTWLCMLAIVLGSGLVLYRRLELKGTRPAETLVLSTGFGFVALIYGTAALAWIGWLRPVPIFLWLGLLTVVAFKGFQRWKPGRSNHITVDQGTDWQEQVRATRWLWLSLAGVGFVYLLSVMAPPLDGDTLHSHLDVPRRYVHAGGIVSLPYEPLASIPLNMQMLSALALLVRGDELAQMLVGFTMAVGAASIIYLLGRRYFSMETGLWAALFFLVTHVVESLVPSTKVDLGRAFFDLLAIFALSRWAFTQEREDRWLVIGGIFSGAGFATSYVSGFTTAVIVFLIGVVTLVQDKNMWARLTGVTHRLLLYGIPLVLLSCPWLIKNYIETGNPVYPVLTEDFSPAQYSTNPWAVLTAPWAMSTHYAPWPYGKPIGPIFLALLPGVLFLRRVPKEIRWALVAVGVLYVMYYYVGRQRPRNFLAELGLLAVIGAWSLSACKQCFPWVRRAFILGLLFLFCFEAAFFVRLHFVRFDKLRYVVGLITRNQFLQQNLALSDAYPHWDMVHYINSLPKDEATVVSLYVGNDYYIDPDVHFIDSRMTDGSFYNKPLNDPQLVLNEWHRLGVRYVFLNELYLENGPVRAADLRLARSPIFQMNCLTPVKESGQQYLYLLTCDRLPPPDKE
ncbi:glycosyltransferase family 39 protein [Acidobacteria bacterium AH-259-A15]|nr:glycosyltransferase family 39 protein [Acidobacteria bacterium AH-259-A15]